MNSFGASSPHNMALRASSFSLNRMWFPLYLSPLRVFFSVPQSSIHSVSGSRRKARVSNATVRVSAINDENIANGGRIVHSELHKEATDAYMSYAMSVLLGRSLPDIRDGLKPVHRRILFAMHELGLSSRKPYKKCARVVGEVLGKFHPHGDTAVYDSLVRMAQDFSLRCPLIQGHGNFGSLDADPPAAMRYTECRLQALTETMLLADLEEDTVDFAQNFDNSQQEPVVLPARIPTLLLNGSSGIAVGMATNIPPHNLGELVDALSALIHNPGATLEELLEHIPGPDFPTGGLIIGNSGISDTYKTGRGRIIVRGKTTIEVLDSKSKQTAIIINEIPYQTNQASLVEKIAELVENKSLVGICDIRDESDRDGMRIVVELKRESVPSIVLNNLFCMTSLQSSFSCNMVGIINGEPRQMGLKELLEAFLEFRCSVIERRARFKLGEAESRRHIVEGIIVGLDNIDGVLRIIRSASTNSLASSNLISHYSLSEKQTEALLGIRLGNLSHIERKKYVDECQLLAGQISELQELLSSRYKILEVVEQEANDLKKRFSTSRRTLLDNEYISQEETDVIPNDEWLLAVSEKGYVKRMNPNNFDLQHRGTLGKSIGKLRVDDTMSDFLVCHAHDRVLFFSDKGTVYSTKAYKIPECTRTASGTPLVKILALPIGGKITSIIPVSQFSGDQYLIMLTLKGYIKKSSLDLFSSIRSSGIVAIQLVPNDELKWILICRANDVVSIASQNGMVVLSACKNIRTLRRKTRGSIAMKLKDGDKMASMDIIPEEIWADLEKNMNIPKTKCLPHGPCLLLVSVNGHGKRVPLTSFRLSSLGRVGLNGYKFFVKDHLAAVFVVGLPSEGCGESREQLLLVSQNGTVNRIKVEDISIKSRYGRGVILMRLGCDDKIQSVSLISESTEAGEEGEDTPTQLQQPLLC